jgi:uncharacterized UPF0160 family protein
MCRSLVGANVEYEYSVIYFNKSHSPKFKLETSVSGIILSYFALTNSLILHHIMIELVS